MASSRMTANCWGRYLRRNPSERFRIVLPNYNLHWEYIMKAIRFVLPLLLLAFAIESVHADVKIKSRMTVMGFNTETTTYIKGGNQRNDINSPYGGGNTYSLYQCDQMRMVQVSTAGKTYYVTSLDEEKAAVDAKTPAMAKKSGATVQMTAKMADTGMKKKILGFDARHVVIDITIEPGPGACTPKSSMKQDVWFIDLPTFAGCANSPREYAKMRPQSNECGDKVNFKMVGAVKPGYPAEMSMTMDGPNGQPVTMKREVVDISTSTLDASLFEIPAGYRQVNSMQELVTGAGMGRGGYSAPSSTATTDAAEEAPARAYPQGYRPTTPEEAKAYGEYLKKQYSGQISEAQNRARQSQQNVDIASATNSRPSAGRTRIGLVVNASGDDSDTAIQHLILRFDSMGVDAVSLESYEGTPLNEQDAAAKENGCDYLLVTDSAVKPNGSAKKKLSGFLNKAMGGEAGSDAPKFDATVIYKLYRVGDATARLDSSVQITDASSAEDGVLKSVDKEVPQVIVQINKDKAVKK